MARRKWGLADVGLLILGDRNWQRLGHIPVSGVSYDWLKVAQFFREFLHCELSQLHNILIVLFEPLC